MGIVKAKIPNVPKVFVWPADMVLTSANPFAFAVSAQYAAHSAPYPSIEGFKGRPMTVFEVLEPSLGRFVDLFNDDLKTAAITSPRLLADGVLKFLQTFLARPAGPVLKVISEKVESLSRLAGVHHTGLARVQGQPPRLGQLTDQCQGRFCFLPAFAKDNEVIRVTDHLVSCHHYGLVHLMQIYVGQQRAYDSPNAKDNFEFFHIIRYQRSWNNT